MGSCYMEGLNHDTIYLSKFYPCAVFKILDNIAPIITYHLSSFNCKINGIQKFSFGVILILHALHCISEIGCPLSDPLLTSCPHH